MSVADFQVGAEDRSLKMPGDERPGGNGSKIPQGGSGINHT
jgi:hypothetical protein